MSDDRNWEYRDNLEKGRKELEEIEKDESIQVRIFGDIIGSIAGQEPSQDFIKFINEKFREHEYSPAQIREFSSMLRELTFIATLPKEEKKPEGIISPRIAGYVPGFVAAAAIGLIFNGTEVLMKLQGAFTPVNVLIQGVLIVSGGIFWVVIKHVWKAQ